MFSSTVLSPSVHPSVHSVFSALFTLCSALCSLCVPLCSLYSPLCSLRVQPSVHSVFTPLFTLRTPLFTVFSPLSASSDDSFEQLRIEAFSSPPELPDVMKPQDSGSTANEQAVQ